MANQLQHTPTKINNELRNTLNWYFKFADPANAAAIPITRISIQPTADWMQFSPHHPIPGPLSHNAQLIVAYQTDLPLAAVALQPVRRDPPRARVARWCTLPQYRHRRIGTTLLAVVGRAALLLPLRLTLLTHSKITASHLITTGQWELTNTHKTTMPGPNAKRKPQHNRLPFGTILYQLEPTLLSLITLHSA